MTVFLLVSYFVTRWSEQLAVYLRTNKQNQKKKRKVEPVASQVVCLCGKVSCFCVHACKHTDYEPLDQIHICAHWKASQTEAPPHQHVF